jgi:excisionase family DNA binding protein
MVIRIICEGNTLFINTEEVAKQLWMTPYTVRKYIRKGILQAVRIGKQYLIRQEDVNRLLEEMRQPKNQQGGQSHELA